MTAPTLEQLVIDYLTRLEQAASTLPPGDREDLIQGIREHIDTAKETGTASDEAGMRTLLDRLGEPEAIVASARDDHDPASNRQPGALVERLIGRASPWGGLEIAAVILLGIGAFVLPILGPLVGLILLWSSPQWTRPQKGIGTAITVVPTLLGAALPGLLLLVVDLVVPKAATGIFTLLAFSAIGPVLAAAYLALALRKADKPLVP